MVLGSWFLIACLQSGMCGPVDSAQQLAFELAREGNHDAAAIEYRRLALMEKDAKRRAGYYWAAAHEYSRLKNYQLVSKMLDRAEDNSLKLSTESLLLRAESALADNALEEAKFYLQSIINSRSADPPAPGGGTRWPAGSAKALASRRLARALVFERDVVAAREALLASPHDNSGALEAIDTYSRGRDKTPRLGGMLGMIPGLGYAYSGEYANALRSLILNGLFIYGMVDTANRELWGAFAVITFFELTWYTGSIYGGVDAAHRYNLDRLNSCLTSIDGNSGFSADLKHIPFVSLTFEF